MTGNETAPAPRKIQALTVSVNYADFLECIAPNVKHFDRWLVVTHESDLRTQEVCRRWGMEVLLSRRLYEGGAAFHKAAALNEGLEVLDKEAWVAVIDSDILLPHDFRERLNAQELLPDCLYGLGGRRICRTLHEFSTLAAAEPWADNLIYTTFVIGYFNLFHLSGERNRYPESVSDDASTYDVVFSDSFPASQRRYLPFVCLHAGDASQNWRGRVTDPFFEDQTDGNTRLEDCTAQAAEGLGGPDKTVAQIGCYRGGFTALLARHFRHVTVIDHWGLRMTSPSPAMAVDAVILESRYARETAGLRNITPPLPHSDETLGAIPDGSLDVIWFTAEPEYDFFLTSLPHWLPKLKPGGSIAGGFYEPVLLPGPSRVVELLLGPPDVTWPDFRWARVVMNPQALAEKLMPRQPVEHGGRGVLYAGAGEDDVEALLVSFSSLRRHWHGPVCILSAGEESPSLRLACIRLGVEFRHVPWVSEKYPDHLNLLHALEWSPFAETLYIAAPTLVRSSPEPLFHALQGRDAVFFGAQGRNPLPVETGAFAWRRGSPVIDMLRALATTFLTVSGRRCFESALAGMAEEGTLPVLPPGPVWSGPARRVPPEACIQEMPRLAQAGALHLLPEWEEEEQALIAIMQQPF